MFGELVLWEVVWYVVTVGLRWCFGVWETRGTSEESVETGEEGFREGEVLVI